LKNSSKIGISIQNSNNPSQKYKNDILLLLILKIL
jgi:hypothetical protein